MAIMAVILLYFILFSVQKQHTELTNHTRSGYSNGHKIFSSFFFFPLSLFTFSNIVQLWSCGFFNMELQVSLDRE